MVAYSLTDAFVQRDVGYVVLDSDAALWESSATHWEGMKELPKNSGQSSTAMLKYPPAWDQPTTIALVFNVQTWKLDLAEKK